MAKEKSDDSRYESRYGGGFLSSSQYIAEIMCERLAKKNKKDLPLKFWNLPAYKRGFLLQVLAANSLLKLYKPKAIIAALRRTPTVFSLRAPWLDDIIKEEQIKLEKFTEIAAPKEEPKVEVNTLEKPRPTFGNKESNINKLRSLD